MDDSAVQNRVDSACDSSPNVKRARRWFRLRFSLTSLLVLMLVLCILLARYAKQYHAYLRERNRIVPTDFDIATGKNVLWSARVGSIAYRNPLLSGDKVFVGTNNEAEYLKRFPRSVDLGVLLCFRVRDGRFLWQASNEKLPQGRTYDWPQQGITSLPCVEEDRLWYVTNRCEVVCLDTEGFYDKEDDGQPDDFGATQDTEREADTVWRFDMIGTLGVSPHNASCSGVAIDERAVFVVTGNGVNETHAHIPNPTAPSFVALDKRTGKLLWSDNSPGKNVMHGQWGSPICAVLGGIPQVLFPGGDGWLYSFEPHGSADGHGTLLWKFDCNPKSSKWELGGRGTRNNLLAKPTIHKERVYIAVGQDPEHGDGTGWMWCIDPTRRGDVSSELVFNRADPATPIPHRRVQACEKEQGEFVKPNPNSAAVWRYGGMDLNADGKIDSDEEMHRSLSRVAIKNDLALITDTWGLVHCIEANTGRGLWQYDLLAACWSSPLISARHVYVTDEDGVVSVFALSGDPAIAMPGGKPVSASQLPDAAYASAASADNVLYIVTRRNLFAIADPKRPRSVRR